MGVDIGSKFNSPIESIGQVVSLIVDLSIVLSSVTVLFIFIFGGFKVIQGAGNDDPQAAAQGKEALTAAVIGFVVVLSSFLIIRVIEEVLGWRIITIPGAGVAVPSNCPTPSIPC